LKPKANLSVEHTLLVTADGVEVLTARFPDSPGGPIPMPEIARVTGVTGVREVKVEAT
jgi:hypothetical protein